MGETFLLLFLSLFLFWSLVATIFSPLHSRALLSAGRGKQSFFLSSQLSLLVHTATMFFWFLRSTRRPPHAPPRQKRGFFHSFVHFPDILFCLTARSSVCVFVEDTKETFHYSIIFIVSKQRDEYFETRKPIRIIVLLPFLHVHTQHNKKMNMEELLNTYRDEKNPNLLGFCLQLVNRAVFRQHRRLLGEMQGNGFPTTAGEDDFCLLIFSKEFRRYHCFAPDLVELDAFLHHLRLRSNTRTTIHLDMHSAAQEGKPLTRFTRCVQRQGNLSSLDLGTVSGENVSQYTLDLIGASQKIQKLELGVLYWNRQTQTALETIMGCVRYHSFIKTVNVLNYYSPHGDGMFSLETKEEAKNHLEAFGRALYNLPNLRTFKLSSAGQNNRGHLLYPPSNSVSVLLRERPIGNFEFESWALRLEDCQVLANSIANSRLCHLSIKEPLFLENEDESFRFLLQGIQELRSLTSLELEVYDPLSVKSVLCLFDLLVQKKELSSFYLNGRFTKRLDRRPDEAVQADYAAYVVAKSLGRSKIQSFTFYGVDFADTGGVDLENALTIKNGSFQSRKRRRPSGTTTASECSTIGFELVKSLKRNTTLKNLNLEGSRMTIALLQEITDCLIGNSKCALTSLILWRLRISPGDFSPNEVILRISDIALKVAIGCPSLTTIKTEGFDEDIIGGPLPRAWLENEDGFRAREEELKIAIAANEKRRDSHLAFNRERKELCLWSFYTNAENDKYHVVAMLAKFTDEQGVLFEALKEFPILFR